MKTIRNLVIGAAAVLMTFAGGCSKDAQYGSMNVRLTDAPADSQYSAIYIDIRSVEVLYVDATKGSSGWVTLDTKAGVYDLLKLQNNVSILIADEATLPIGRIAQVRLILGDHNYAVIGGIEYAITVPSGLESGIKINVDGDLSADFRLDVVLDFDAKASVVLEGNGSFLLKPVILVRSIGTIDAKS